MSTVCSCPGANATFGEADIDFDRFDGAKVFHFGHPPLMEQEYELYVPCIRVQCAGATGAGDCTIYGFLAELLQGGTPKQAATMVVTGGLQRRSDRRGQRHPHLEEVQQRIDATSPHLICHNKVEIPTFIQADFFFFQR